MPEKMRLEMVIGMKISVSFAGLLVRLNRARKMKVPNNI